MVRGALKALLELEGDFEVVAEASDTATAIAETQRLQPDVCVLDIEMPGGGGLVAAERLRLLCPTVSVLIVTTFARPGYLARALGAGARGYLMKSAPATQLATAIRRVHAGERVIDPELAAEALGGPNPLTERERDVLRLVDAGHAGGRIASLLSLSEGTVRNYLSEAMAKLGVRTRAEAARIARDKGWI
ncbi:MAG: two-component system, NarL family, response regulator DesR [Chloroflexota bacterium]|nr:two-component system, NarL family, response regulator DesR [Chloroflexota bacterium]